jgi:hypothetical protein
MSIDEEQPRRHRLELVSTEKLSVKQDEAISTVDCALRDCGLTDPGQRRACLSRIVNLPNSLLLPTLRCSGLVGTPPEGFIDEIIPRDRDNLARMLRLNEGTTDPSVTWQDLTRAEQMRATRLWGWIADADPADISTERKGRPAETDSALVLYLMFVLLEATGRPKFSYSTQNEVRRGGPMLRVLMAALQFCRVIGARPAPHDPTADAVVTRIIKTARSAEFRQEAEHFSLSLTADGVADAPSTFRYLVARVMKQRRHRTRTD